MDLLMNAGHIQSKTLIEKYVGMFVKDFNFHCSGVNTIFLETQFKMINGNFSSTFFNAVAIKELINIFNISSTQKLNIYSWLKTKT